jgi:protein arginine kinase activator
MDLCEGCAQAKGVTNPENLSISSLMDKVELEVDSSGATMVCESCGTTHQEFKKGGRLGCEACYHVFRPVLDPLLDGMHAGTKHLGKVPAGSESRIQFEQSMHSLKQQLKDAVEKEDYEKAAELRDKLRDLENQTKSIV